MRGITEAASTDVLVVGLGPAGASAARAAAAAGWRVVAVDRRRRAGYPVQCAEFIPFMLSQELADLERVTHQRITSMLTYIEGGLPDEKERFPGRMIDRGAFDAALVRRAAEAGTACRFGTELRTLAPDGAALLSDGSTVRAKVVIGADGPRSRVGRAVGRINRELVDTRQVTVALNRGHSATDIFLSAHIPGGYGWLFPKGRVANLGVGVAPWARARLKPLLDALHARLIDEGRVGAEVMAHTGGAIPVGGALDPVAEPRKTPVLLAGDAAGLANPVTGAGIASAVISGAMAGAAAGDCLAGDPDALAAYRDEVEALFKPALDRAVRRRREILQSYREGGKPTPSQLRRGWIAYPEYWAA